MFCPAGGTIVPRADGLASTAAARSHLQSRACRRATHAKVVDIEVFRRVWRLSPLAVGSSSLAVIAGQFGPLRPRSRPNAH